MGVLDIDLRRLAAIDMWSSAGAPWRRWVILGEFLLGAIGGVVLGVLVMSGGGTGRLVFGAWIVGVGLNYVPLSAHALALSRPGALEAEIAGVDVPATLRSYTVRRLWVLVPLLFVVLAFWGWRRRR